MIQDIKGPSVRDVFTFGYATFPNAPRDWPTAHVSVGQSVEYFDRLHDMILWCDLQFGRSNWYRRTSTFYFNDEQDALLFKLRYCE